ncbi:MAG: hypothetical protein AAF990_28465, partial [Bacteroidota bacterium]
MKTFYLLFLTCCLLCLSQPNIGVAQTMNLSWQKTFDGKGNEQFNDLIEATNGNLVAVGKSSSQSAGGDDGYLVFADFSTGANILERRFGGKKNEEFKAVVQTFDGGFVLAGSTESNTVGKKDAWLMKVDEYGTLLWEKSFGSKGSDSWECLSIQSDGSLVAAGYWDGNVRVAKLVGQEIEWETIIGKGKYDNLTGMAMAA